MDNSNSRECTMAVVEFMGNNNNSSHHQCKICWHPLIQ